MLSTGRPPSGPERPVDHHPLGKEKAPLNTWDLTRGGLPVVLVGGMLVSALIAGMWIQDRTGAGAVANSSITELKLQVQQLQATVNQISVNLAKGPTLPENVAYKADLLRFCVMNRQLQCPQF